MNTLKIYQPNMQSDIEAFFKVYFTALGWEYLPEGRHSDIVHVDDVYG